ncbi:DUF4097 family beta strand repeat-containing protein [Ulvibacter antarcticus]|uniref:Uncharacterized protein n=1 Tax=Ulvibacter antarcticus TaxID=442714 RepID=A0A3L9YB57_9FLAO|nr:DUF4097 family beta strand repeat-containing protein [Ulvibacter antarcticus]RMA57941.1 hypothetical protein BXY75_2748 [Ulvibacter antarcticus]
MSNLTVINHKLITVLLLLVSSLVLSQDRFKESFKVNKDALVSVDVAYSDVIIETWNKDYVEVEAFIEGNKLSEKDKKEIFDKWNLNVLGNSKKVVISSSSANLWGNSESHDLLRGLEHLKEMPLFEELGNLNWDVVVPDVPNLEKMPVWPFNNSRPKVKWGDDRNQININHSKTMTFDATEYEKDKNGYVAKLNKKYDTNVSVKAVDKWLRDVDKWTDNIEVVMEDWGEKFGNEFELKFGPEFEKKMEAWGKEFELKMEDWGEDFGKEMEKWGESLGKDIEQWAKQFDDSDEGLFDDNNKKIIIMDGNKKANSKHSNAKKKIIIKMPKGTKTDINVRHGEVKMADVYNINATLKYAPFTANSIDGGNTLINASYAPVAVNNWVNGVLQINYVDDCKINEVQKINLKANSSDVVINTIYKNAFLSGSFGNLYVNKLANNFEAIDVILENTDASVKIPETPFSFYFNGKKSTVKYPKSMELNATKNKENVLVKGFHKNKNPESMFTINATYSNVILK